MLPFSEASRNIKNMLLGQNLIINMKSFVIVALLGATQAISCAPKCGCDGAYAGGYAGGQGYALQSL